MCQAITIHYLRLFAIIGLYFSLNQLNFTFNSTTDSIRNFFKLLKVSNQVRRVNDVIVHCNNISIQVFLKSKIVLFLRLKVFITKFNFLSSFLRLNKTFVNDFFPLNSPTYSHKIKRSGFFVLTMNYINIDTFRKGCLRYNTFIGSAFIYAMFMTP